MRGVPAKYAHMYVDGVLGPANNCVGIIKFIDMSKYYNRWHFKIYWQVQI